MAEKRKLTDYIKLIGKGFCMGIADIIPGISGGTIAFILGIYEDFILSIKSFDANFVAHILKFRFKEAFRHAEWQFLGSIMCGIVLAVLCMSRILSWLLANYPILVHAFFFGLIVATVPIISRVIGKWDIKRILALIIATLSSYYIIESTPLNTPDSLWFVFLCGAIAISAMILPGISGAYLLVILGKYQAILDAIRNSDFILVGVFLLGIVVGIISFVRVLSYLFGRFHDTVIAVLTGIVIGSLSRIWPWKNTITSIVTSKGKVIPIKMQNYIPSELSAEVLFSIVLIGIGFGIANALSPEKRTKKIKL